MVSANANRHKRISSWSREVRILTRLLITIANYTTLRQLKVKWPVLFLPRLLSFFYAGFLFHLLLVCFVAASSLLLLLCFFRFAHFFPSFSLFNPFFPFFWLFPSFFSFLLSSFLSFPCFPYVLFSCFFFFRSCFLFLSFFIFCVMEGTGI